MYVFKILQQEVSIKIADDPNNSTKVFKTYYRTREKKTFPGSQKEAILLSQSL